MPAVLRVSGPFQLLEESLRDAPFDFTESVASRRNRERLANAGWSTFNFTISEMGGDRVADQICEAAQFFSRNIDAIGRIRELPGVEHICIDFSWDLPATKTAQTNRLPSSFLKACAAMGIDVEMSVYAVGKRG